MKCKPDYILLHVGTNNSTSSTTDEVMKELNLLKEYIELVLPSTSIIISLPTVRVDNSKAKVNIRNLNTKSKKSNYMLLDNTNIREYNLGKRSPIQQTWYQKNGR